MARVTAVQRQARAVAILERRDRYQFGQPRSDQVGNAGCADTIIQAIVRISRGKNVSLNEVRRRTGAATGAPTMTSEALRGLRRFGLSYAAQSGLDAKRVVTIASHMGPVFLCYRYWSGPQWKGYRYAGRLLNGVARNDTGQSIRVGFARPASRSGLTQWTFRGGHAALVVGSVTSDDTELAIVRDPNHNSSARPERPAYDLVTLVQLDRMLESWGSRSLVLVPREASRPPNVPTRPDRPRVPKPNDPDVFDEPWLDPETDDIAPDAVTAAGFTGLTGAVTAGGIILGAASIVLLAGIAASRQDMERE